MKHKFLYKIENVNGQIKGDWYVIDAYWREQGLDVRDQLNGQMYKSIYDLKRKLVQKLHGLLIFLFARITCVSTK